jgi:Domain of unknown function (DUF1707)/2TM domain
MEEGLVRIGDEERERTVALLHEHASRGRLDPEELDDRVERALRARTRADLAALTADLPEATAAPPSRRRPSLRAQKFRRNVGIWAVMSVFFILIWAAGGGGSFWPVWPILGWGLALGIQAVKLATGDDDQDEPDRDALPRGT